MKWPEWLVLTLSFFTLAIISFEAKSFGNLLRIEPEIQKYLMFGAFFGLVFLVLAIASLINLIITATREYKKRNK